MMRPAYAYLSKVHACPHSTCFVTVYVLDVVYQLLACCSPIRTPAEPGLNLAASGVHAVQCWCNCNVHGKQRAELIPSAYIDPREAPEQIEACW
jgi:hypothetical protein